MTYFTKANSFLIKLVGEIPGGKPLPTVHDAVLAFAKYLEEEDIKNTPQAGHKAFSCLHEFKQFNPLDEKSIDVYCNKCGTTVSGAYIRPPVAYASQPTKEYEGMDVSDKTTVVGINEVVEGKGYGLKPTKTCRHFGTCEEGVCVAELKTCQVPVLPNREVEGPAMKPCGNLLPCHEHNCTLCDLNERSERFRKLMDRHMNQHRAKPASWEEEFAELLNEHYGNAADSSYLHAFVRSLLASKEKEVLQLAKGCVPPEGVLDPEKFPFEEKWYETHAENDGWNTCRAATLEALAKLEGKGE